MTKQKFIKTGGGKAYDYSQDHCFVKLPFSDTQGVCSMVEDTLKPGFYLERHYHKIMTEVFYVLEGELALIFDDETLPLQKGDTLTVPPNVWHAAKSEAGAKMLTIFVNGRFDEYLEQLSTMTDEDFADADKMKALNAEFDIYHE